MPGHVRGGGGDFLSLLTVTCGGGFGQTDYVWCINAVQSVHSLILALGFASTGQLAEEELELDKQYSVYICIYIHIPISKQKR